jgi:hypothetical protein
MGMRVYDKHDGSARRKKGSLCYMTETENMGGEDIRWDGSRPV